MRFNVLKFTVLFLLASLACRADETAAPEPKRLVVPSTAVSSREGQGASQLVRQISSFQQGRALPKKADQLLSKFPGCFLRHPSEGFLPWYENLYERISSLPLPRREEWFQEIAEFVPKDLEKRLKAPVPEALAAIALRFPGRGGPGEMAKLRLAALYLKEGKTVASALLFGDEPDPVYASPQDLLSGAKAWALLGDKARMELWLKAYAEYPIEKTDAMKQAEADARSALSPVAASSALLDFIADYFKSDDLFKNPSWVARCFSGATLVAMMKERCGEIRSSPSFDDLFTKASDEAEVVRQFRSAQFRGEVFLPVDWLFEGCTRTGAIHDFAKSLELVFALDKNPRDGQSRNGMVALGEKALRGIATSLSEGRARRGVGVAIELLGDSANQFFLKELANPDPLSRARAARALGLARVESAIPDLQKASRDGEMRVRLAAWDALEILGVKVVRELDAFDMEGQLREMERLRNEER